MLRTHFPKTTTKHIVDALHHHNCASNIYDKGCDLVFLPWSWHNSNLRFKFHSQNNLLRLHFKIRIKERDVLARLNMFLKLWQARLYIECDAYNLCWANIIVTLYLWNGLKQYIIYTKRGWIDQCLLFLVEIKHYNWLIF